MVKAIFNLNIFNNIKGMNLIEVLVVLGISAILVGLALPQIKVSQLGGAARMIFFDLQYARMEAIKKKNNFRVVFNNENGHTYKIHDDQDGDGSIDDGEKVIIKDIHENFPGVIFGANNNPVYNSVGTVSPSYCGHVKLKDSSIFKYVIFSWTGSIRISDKAPS